MDSRLMLYIGRSSFITLSYCFQAIVYGVHRLWYLLGNGKDFGMLAW